jgi:DNA-directed RNA polymerase subunit N (RpoN/RPB10)
MKCGSCGRKISSVRRAYKRYLTKQDVFTVDVISDETGEVITSFPVCDECAELYILAQKLVEEYGMETAMDILMKAFTREDMDEEG